MSETTLLVPPIFKFLKDGDNVFTGKHYMGANKLKRGDLDTAPLHSVNMAFFRNSHFQLTSTFWRKLQLVVVNVTINISKQTRSLKKNVRQVPGSGICHFSS